MNRNKKPIKPDTVPVAAKWNSDENEWELGEENSDGIKKGEWKWWLAPKGHLCCQTFFDDNGRVLSYTRFHPNGEKSRQGKFENGNLVEDIYYRCSEKTTEYYVYGAPKNAWKAITKIGQVPIAYDFYDREGNHINREGIKYSELGRVKKEAKEKARKKAEEILKVIQRDTYNITISSKSNSSRITPKEAEINYTINDFIHNYGLNYNSEIILYKGDTFLKQLELDELEDGVAGIIVDGNLVIENHIINYERDYGPFLYVKENLKCCNLVLGGSEVWIKNNIYIEKILYTSYNHGILTVEGNTNAELAILNDHCTRLRGKINTLVISDSEGKFYDRDFKAHFTQEDYLNVLNDNVKDCEADYEYINHSKIVKAIEFNKQVLIEL